MLRPQIRPEGSLLPVDVDAAALAFARRAKCRNSIVFYWRMRFGWLAIPIRFNFGRMRCPT